jgi:predicted RNA-binding protein associated with RNAse of E/G family
MWSSGEVVALRELAQGRPWKARAWIVVEDRPDALVLWIPRGSQTMIPAGEAVLPSGDWRLVEGSFGLNALRVTRPGEAHSVLHFFADDGAFHRWYVNLETPLIRSHVGFDFTDLFLDLSVTPDGIWRWLDEHELEQAVTVGVLSPEEAAAARAEGERVIAHWPFPTGWEDFRPDPAWPVPLLPAGWESVSD